MAAPADQRLPKAAPPAATNLPRTIMPIVTALLVGLALVLLLAVAWLGAPMPDLADLGVYLVGSGIVSLVLGVVGALWLRRGRAPLWLQITLTYCLGVGIALFNIFLTARLMFISTHDLPLLVLLLLFAAVVSLGLGYALAHTLARRVTALHQGARRVAEGDLSARVPTEGRDELARLAREFNRMAEQLSASAAERARMEQARRELVAAVSHDLRTPLASLRAMTEALSDGLIDDPATTARYLATMQGQITHLSGLIDDLFELAQIDAGALRLDMQRIAPGDLISDAIEGMRPQANARGVRLEGSVAPDLGPLLVAPQKIERVIYNLVTNAIRHTPADGNVTLRVYPSPAELLPARPFVVFEVEDTGEGIAPEDLPHVFERFYRGEKSRSRATGGAGLGLAIARGIVEAHGGRIWFEPGRQQGTRVAFALPCGEA
ncbi:MAG TPA: ATP-binding protein [Roseiflexaceae bacterium]|nr:ATP-binding protein [Roseiflexaceae bacterium]